MSDAEHSGRAVGIVPPETSEKSATIHISYDFVVKFLNIVLRIRKLFARWVPRLDSIDYERKSV